MLKSRLLRSSVSVTGLLVTSFFVACGGSTDGLFTGSAGSGANAGIGSPSNGGTSANGGAANTAGANHSAGAGTVAGANSGGQNNTGGNANGGSGAGGNSNGGVAGTGTAGTGSPQGGDATGGAAGSGTAGTESGGANNGGSSTGGVDSGGSGGAVSCSDLFSRATNQLAAAQVCNKSGGAGECSGKVKDNCGCTVPVESMTSSETQAYLETQKQIQAQHCTMVCGNLACSLFTKAECHSQGQSGAMCVAAPGPITN